MARKLNQYGIPELTTFDSQLEEFCRNLDLHDDEENESSKDLTILLIYRAIGGIEGAGVFGFADQVWDLEGTLEAFKTIGCEEIARKIEYMNANDSLITDVKVRREMEEDVYELLQTASEKLLDFWKRG
jgi:hypothetical protein